MTRTGLAMVRAVLAVLAVALTGGCDGSQKGSDDPVKEDTTAASVDEDAGQRVLDGFGAQIAATVRDLTKPVQALEVSADTDPSQTSCKDTVGDDPWPQRQSFTANVFVADDSRPLARDVAEGLHRDGWTVQDTGRVTGPQTQHYVARRGGFVISIGSTTGTVAALVISGTTPCVRLDGTVQA